MGVSVFLSVPHPHMSKQDAFIGSIREYLRSRGLEPRTLGVTDYDTHNPLTAVRRMLIESNGLLSVAFRRVHVTSATLRDGADFEQQRAAELPSFWLTSPWCHIETAMAFQMGLPILILRERGVKDEGILEKGVSGLYLPEFDLDDPKSFDLGDSKTFAEGRQLLSEWEGYVRHVVRIKGLPPQLYY